MAKINVDTQALGNMKINNLVPSSKWNSLTRFGPLPLSNIVNELEKLSINTVWDDLRIKAASISLKKYANELRAIIIRIYNFNNYMSYFTRYETLDREISEKAANEVDVTVSVSEGEANRINLLYERILLGTATAAEIEEYVKLYEQTLTEYERKNMEEFFNVFPDEDAAKIKEMLYTTEEPLRSEIVNMIKSGGINFTTATSGSSYYNSGSNTLCYNINTFKNDPRGSYFTVWHELGHAHDDFSSGIKNIDWTDAFTTDDGKSINDLIKENLRTTINNRCDQLYPNLSEAEKKEIADYLISKRQLDIPLLNIPKAVNISEQIQSELKIAGDISVSDCYSCITNHVIYPGYCGQKKQQCHEKKYADELAQCEAYADYIAINMTKNKGAESSYKYYMPSVYSEIDRHFKENAKANS